MRQARAQEKPLLVYFDALWCSWCQQYKRDVLDRPDVKQFLRRHYIRLVVDFDARPDLFEQYGGKGLPYTVIVSDNGDILNRFVGILSEKDFLETLAQYADRSGPAGVRVEPVREQVFVTGLDVKQYDRFRAAFLDHVASLYDPKLKTLVGQYETGATLKRPSPRTWAYLADHNLWPDRVRPALDAERQRLLDPHDGGFFNFLDPARTGGDYLETSKLLEANARLIAWFASHGEQNAATRNAALSGWRFLREVLWDNRRGGFWQSQLADNTYYALPLDERRAGRRPEVDAIKRADTNAEAAYELWRAGKHLNHPELQRYATRTLDYILNNMVKDDQLFHLASSSGLSVPALPEDRFWVLLAAREIGKQRLGIRAARQLGVLAQQAATWLSRRMKQGAPIPVALAGVIASVSCGSQSDYLMLPPATCEWALTQLNMQSETPPDDVVLGLRAWERRLGAGH